MLTCQGKRLTVCDLRDAYRGALKKCGGFRSHTARVRFPGICSHAEALGVNRVTIYRLLTDPYFRKSLPTLTRRYEELTGRKVS